MATGVRPFTGDTNLPVLSAIIPDSPKSLTEVNPGLPRDLASSRSTAGLRVSLTTFTDGKSLAGFAWSPDGKQLALARAVRTSDIVLLKGVR